MFSPVTILHRAYFNLLPYHDSILFSLSLKHRKAWWSNYIHILHKWLNANCDWLQEIRTSPVTVRRMSMKAAESQRVSSPLRNLLRLVPRLPGSQAEWWDGRRKAVERTKKKRKEKGKERKKVGRGCQPKEIYRWCKLQPRPSSQARTASNSLAYISAFLSRRGGKPAKGTK